MLTQTVFQGDASELISKDLMERFHSFLGILFFFKYILLTF